LQIKYFLLTVTSTVDELDDLEPPKYKVSVIFFAILGCDAYINSELH